MPFLMTVSLQNSVSISDGGCAALAQIQPLRALNLKGCKDISDQGLSALEPLQRLTNLRIQVPPCTEYCLLPPATAMLALHPSRCPPCNEHRILVVLPLSAIVEASVLGWRRAMRRSRTREWRPWQS